MSTAPKQTARAQDRHHRSARAQRVLRPAAARVQAQDRPGPRRGAKRRQDAGGTGARKHRHHLERRLPHRAGDHHRDRPQALRADQPDPSPRRLPAARRRMARPALPGQQHRDRRAAQDPRDVRIEARSGALAQAPQGHRLGPEPAVQEDLRARSTASSAANRSARSSATFTSTTARPTWRCSAKWPRLPRPRTAPSLPAHRPP